jgi:hypothetical protein
MVRPPMELRNEPIVSSGELILLAICSETPLKSLKGTESNVVDSPHTPGTGCPSLMS